MESRSYKTLTRSNITACLRCRKKKQRCDQRLPKCGPCQKSKSDCVGYDAVAKRLVPRSYINSLEERIALLEIRLRDHGIGIDDIEDSTELRGSIATPSRPSSREATQRQSTLSNTEANAEIEALLSNSVQVTVESLSSHQHIGSSNGMSFTRLFLAELQRDGASPRFRNETPKSGQAAAEYSSFEPPKDLDPSPQSLPERNAAESLVKVYFELPNFSLPGLIFHEPTFRQWFDLVYSQEINDDVETARKRKRGIIFCYLVFSIALLALQKRGTESVSTSLYERYHNSALYYLDGVGLDLDIESIQVLLLLANYSYLHPSFLGPWRLVGMAIRYVIELGLHQDPSPGTMSPLLLDTRRRVFWVTYSMDRNLGIYLGRPFGFSDGSVNVEFPSTVPDKFITDDGITTDSSNQEGRKVFAMHFLRYRRLQSEIYTILHERHPPTCPYPPLDYNAWQQSVYHRLAQWHESTPKSEAPEYVVHMKGLEMSYYAALILILRPSPAIPSPSETSLLLLMKAASQTIRLYREIASEKKLNLFWQASHNLFAAGTAILYSLSHSRGVPEGMSQRSLISDAHACAAVLWAMAERFPAAKGTREAFDIILSSALDSLQDNDNYASVNIRSSAGSALDYSSGRLSAQDNSVASPFDTSSVPELAQYTEGISNLPSVDIGSNADMYNGKLAVDNAWSIGNLENGFDLSSLYMEPSLYVDLN